MRAMTALLILFIVTAPASAATWRKVGNTKGFDGMRAEMQRLVDNDPDIKTRINHLCVVVEHPDDPKDDVGPVAWVYLRERAYLVPFTAPAHGAVRDGDIWGASVVDLRRDVVASNRDIKGSASRVTRAYVDRIIRACGRHGDLAVIEKLGG